MELRIDETLDRRVIQAAFDIMDDVMDGVITKNMGNSIVYVIGSIESLLVPTIVKILSKAKLNRFIPVFKDVKYRNKEFVFCIGGGDLDPSIKSLIVKFNVEKKDGYTTISLNHFVKRLIVILRSKDSDVSKTITDMDEIVDRVIREIPLRVKDAELSVEQQRPVPQFYI